MRKLVLTLWVFVSAVLTAAAQAGHFISSDRFSSGLINDVCQDHYGYIWVATDYGLNRFDGYQFITYRHQPADSTSISNNVTVSLLTDSHGRLWVGSGSGLDRYDYATDSFVHYKFNTGVTPRVTSLIQCRDGRLLVGTAGYGLFMLSDPGDDGDRLLRHVVRKYGPSGDDSFYSYIVEDSQLRIWKGSYNNQMAMRDKQGLHAMTVSSGDIVGLIETYEEAMLAVCSHGLELWRDGKREEASFDLSVFGGREINFLCGFRDHAGNIFVGTRGDGLFCMAKGSRKLVRVECNSKDIDLSTAKVKDITEDRDGNLWISCDLMGLVVLERTPPQFSTWSFRSQGLRIGSTASSVCEGDGDVVWCVIQAGGIYGFDRAGRLVAHPSCPPKPESVYRDRSGRYWVGTDNALFLWNPATGQSQKKLTLDCDRINDITDLGDGKLYVSTFSRGFCSYDIATGQWRTFAMGKGNASRGSLWNNWILAMSPDRAGRLWLATSSGVSCYDPRKDSFRSLGFDVLLQGVVCNALCETSRGDMLIGTERGLYIYKPGQHEATLLQEGNALTDKSVNYIVEASNGDIWCSTSSGLWQYDVSNRYFIRHISDNGLSSKEYIVGVGVHTDSDMIIFANNEGLVAFSPNNVKQQKQSLPPVVLSSFILAGRPISVNTLSDGSPITEVSVTESNFFRLSYLDNTFSMEFSLLNYEQPSNVIYEYRIDNGEWQQNHEGYNSVHMNHLQPGTYRLQVRAMLSGIYSEPRTFTIRITPPWYRSTLAYIIYIIVLLSIITLIGWLLRRHANQQLDEAKMKFLINATHDIRSPLTLIMGAIEKLKATKLDDLKTDADVRSFREQRLRPSVEAIERNAQRLMLLVNQILDERRIDKKQMRLRCRETDMVEFISAICKLYEFNSDQRGIKFSFTHDSDHIMAWIDRINFDKVLSNLLSNAFKYTCDEGEVKVVLRDDANSVSIDIIDSGLGVKPEDVEHLFDRFYQGRNASDMGIQGTGIGLNLSKAITEMHGGHITVAGRTDGQRGACFTVTLPKGNAHLKADQIETAADSNGQTSAPASGQRQSRPFHILIVDDDAEIANYISSELAGRYRFHYAANGREGLKMLLTANAQSAATGSQPAATGAQHPIDLVISDVMMPEMDGITMLRRIKENPQVSQTPVILLTSKSEVEHKLEGLKSGADAYIAKPFNMEELHVQIDNLIDNVRRLRGKFSGAVQQEQRVENIEMRGNDDVLMDRIMKSINAHMSDADFNVDTLASDVGISRAQLHRKMKEMTGIASGKFLRNLRMEQAARLLREGKVNVSQVAYRVGYADQAHFSTAFKAHFGLSPSEYAERNKNQSE